jgi:two-component system copper resistance phosphate regulon response regulator CusR
MRILVVEDDNAVARFLSKGLQAEHYAVDVKDNGEEALAMARDLDYDLVVLDLSLPGIDGLTVLRHIRAKKDDLPIIVLSGRSALDDRVKGLDLGADDYLAKPFSFRELSARVRALLRRGRRPPESMLQTSDLEISRVDRTVKRAGKNIELTSKEFALLEYLMRNVGRPVTRAMIIEHVWNLSFDTMTNVVDVYINYLRKKVDEEFELKLIRTIRGVGYQLGGDGEEQN